MGSSRLTQSLLVSKGTFLSLVYHDIFDYPLTTQELEKWEVRSGKIDSEVGSGDRLAVEKTGEYYHLPGRAGIILLRKLRERSSKSKLTKAKLAARVIFHIPTVLFVGLTGSLSMGNAEDGADIDFLIVTRKGTMWMTRIVVHLLLRGLGVSARRASSGDGKDRLCLNMWVDERSLVVPKSVRNIYAAHEVLQVVPLSNKEKTYEKFLQTNEWVGEYWRSSSKFKVQNSKLEKQTKSNPLFIIHSLLTTFLEPLAYRLQLLYMGRRITRETIEIGRAFFHPFGWSELVLREFNGRKVKYLEKSKLSEVIMRGLTSTTVVSYNSTLVR